MKSYDFRKAPKCSCGNFKWNKYYWQRTNVALAYENDYWGEVIDPDGKIRNMQSPREWRRHIEDLKFIIDKIHEFPSGRFLDVGCGLGYLLCAIDSSWDKYGVDVSRFAVESASRFAKVRQGEFPSLKYKSNYFDVVIMNHVIEHVREPLRYIKACRRVLKYSGIFIIATPDFDSGCARFFGKNYRMLHDKGHISLFTSFSLIKMLEDFKFRIIEVECPFFKTRWFTKGNLLKMLDNSGVSPAFYGNHVVVIAQKESR